jgi:TonB family protein
VKSLLWSIILLAQFSCLLAQGEARGQSAPAPQPATPTDQTAALKEADSLNLKAVQLFSAAKYDEALPLAEHALKLREEAAGRDHQSVADALKNLGAIYFARGKPDKSRQHYKRALSIYEKNPAGKHANISQLLDALGIIERFAFGNYLAAVEHYERSLAVKENALGMEHEEVFKNLYDLAELYELLGRNSKAIEVHRRMIASREKRAATLPGELIFALRRFTCLSERLDMKAETAEAQQRIEQLVAASEEKRKLEAPPPGEQKPGDDAVRGGVLNGKAISKPQPVYPAAAKRQRISGTVTIFVSVDETGRVVEAHPCGHPLLSESSLHAAYMARFSPTLLDGKPVKVSGVITYRFVLQ